MASLNQVTLLGHVGSQKSISFRPNDDPEKAKLRFSLATNNFSSTPQETKPEWHVITLWGKQATTIQPMISQGKLLLVVGRLHYYDWTNPEGVTTRYAEIIASKVQICSPRGNSAPEEND